MVLTHAKTYVLATSYWSLFTKWIDFKLLISSMLDCYIHCHFEVEIAQEMELPRLIFDQVAKTKIAQVLTRGNFSAISSKYS